ncbi:MAG: dihydroneopterin aldolase [Synergistaceae bacterium]|jgi:dihydroneopterin aldolase|nr:dihydroneopterin aldolase [Synergistaceae bacterium]
MRGTYTIKGMSFHAFHGVMEVERELGQVFLVDVTLGLELDSKNSSPSVDSNLRGAVIYDLTKNVMMGTKYKSHTWLALRIAQEMLGNLKEVTDVSVVIERRNLFIAGDVQGSVIEVSCSREEFEKKG